MVLVTVINYAGLFIPYAMLVPLGMKHLPVRYMTTFVFVMLFFRNALAPVAGMSLYTNWLQERQQHYIQRLAQNVDYENQQAATYDYGLRRMGQAKGGSTLEAQQLSATAMRGKITVQATLVAMRDITGTTIWLLVGTLAFVLFFIGKISIEEFQLAYKLLVSKGSVERALINQHAKRCSSGNVLVMSQVPFIGVQNKPKTMLYLKGDK